MTLTTHILIATAVAKPFYGADPALIFGIALASHYLADAIPHWDYHLTAYTHKAGAGIGEHAITPDPKAITKDLARIGLDIAIGSAAAFFMSGHALTFAGIFPVALTIVGAILPDSLQPVYVLWRRPPITWIHHFHTFMHSKIFLSRLRWDGARYIEREPKEATRLILTGKVSQILIALFALWVITLS